MKRRILITMLFAFNFGLLLYAQTSPIENKVLNSNLLEDKINGTTLSGLDILHPVLVEEATGTWCGFCPRGAVYMDSLSKKYGDNFIGIAVHNGMNDPMVVTEYDAGVTNFPGFSGFPSAIVGRNFLVSPEDIEIPFLQEASTVATVSLSATATYDANTRELTINASSTTSKNYVAPKFFIALVEDGVHGTTSGYNQSNYYSGGGLGVMGGFEILPNPVPAAKMVFNHVARALFGGYNGLSGTIKSPWLVNSTANYEKKGYIIPNEFNIANMHAVVGVMSNQNKFLNIIKLPIEKSTASNEVSNNRKVLISPNPISTVGYIQINQPGNGEITVKICDVLGNVVAKQNYGKSNDLTSLPIVTDNLSNGNYFVHIQIDNETIVKQIAVIKN
jgi:thiol-disulfide isomerase/thioredoxin